MGSQVSAFGDGLPDREGSSALQITAQGHVGIVSSSLIESDPSVGSP